MRKAAKRVINTLGVSDFFAVIEFSSQANVLGNDNLMMRATDKNKEEMVQRIDNLVGFGATRFYDAFDLAFRTLGDSALEDKVTNDKHFHEKKKQHIISEDKQMKQINPLVNNINNEIILFFSKCFW